MRVTLISKGAVAEIDTLGAQLVSYQDVVNTEYLWQGDPAYWKGQAPILFPIVGALRNERAVIAERPIPWRSMALPGTGNLPR